MELKSVIILCVLFIGVNSQYGVKTAINQTQVLQNIERYGSALNDIYDNWTFLKPKTGDQVSGKNETTPERNETTPGVKGSWQPVHHNQTSEQIRQWPVHQNETSFNITERFLNKTKSSMPKGVCVEEVPTVSLLRPNEAVVAGNGSNPSLSRIQVCCEGYQRNIHNFRKCDPICKNDCVNGFCSAPDTCVCYPDHVRNLGGFCLPTCPIMCGNGRCNQDNTCTCNDGFVLEVNGKFCVPTCSKACHNGNCTAPDECTCNKGFALSQLGKCEPFCSKGCRNGECVAPDVCSCQKGYSKVDDGCEPICSNGCSNGKCIAPEVCECTGYGWSLDSTGKKCVGSCDKPCLNGDCTGPNICTCRTGYTLDVFDSFRCVPKCDPPCSNGVCSGPNMCICSPGYIKDRSVKGSPRCVKV